LFWRGHNLLRVETKIESKESQSSVDSKDTRTALCVVPAKFNKLIWIKIGQFCIVQPHTLFVNKSTPLVDQSPITNPIPQNTQPSGSQSRSLSGALVQSASGDVGSIEQDLTKIATKKTKPRKLTETQKKKEITKQKQKKKEKEKERKNMKKEKIQYCLVHILLKPQIDNLQSLGLWPSNFANQEPLREVSDEYQLDGHSLQDEDKDRDPILFRNTNHDFGLASQDDSDEDDP